VFFTHNKQGNSFPNILEKPVKSCNNGRNRKGEAMKRILSVLTIILMAFISCQSLSARKPLPSFYVNANGDDNNDGLTVQTAFKTLNKALSSADEGVIKIITVIGTLNMESESSDYEGNALFYINLENDEQITITGRDGALDATGCGNSVLRIAGSSVIRLENIVITGGVSAYGGGINIDGVNPTVIIGKGTEVTGNYAGWGGGIAISNGRLFMEDGTVSKNSSNEASNGGGISVINNAEFIMKSGTISNNEAGFGGGVHVQGSFILKNGTISENNSKRSGGGGVGLLNGKFLMEGGVISGNKGHGENNGGGVYVYSTSEFTMTGGEITNNEAGWGGGIFSDNILIIKNGTVSGNRAELPGGGIYIFKGKFFMEGGVISGNKCGVDNSGGGVFLFSNTEFTMTGGSIINNEAGWGGGVNSQGNFILKNGNISNNIAIKGCGGARIDAGKFLMEGGIISGNKCGTEYGGGGVIIREEAEFTMTGGEITNNEAGWGGGIYGETTAFTMTGGKIINNQAEWGGGIYNIGNMTIKNSIVSDNRAERSAGGIAVRRGKLTMEDTIVSGNKCGTNSNGGGVNVWEETEFSMHGGEITNNEAGYGGGLYNDGSSLINNVRISGNNASTSGGAAYNGGSLSIKNSEASGNRAEFGGGVFSSEKSSIIISDSAISKNKANWGGGVYIKTAKKSFIENTIISDNKTEQAGGGIYVEENAELNIKDSRIHANEAIAGGGIATIGKTEIINTTISGNYANENGGGIVVYLSGYLHIKDSKVHSNQSTQYGGGFTLMGKSEIINTSINYNQAVWGGGIAAYQELKIQNSIIRGNRAFWGGGMSNSNSNTELIKCEISQNYAFTGGGGISINGITNLQISDTTISDNKSQDGGGIHIDNGKIIISSGIFQNNTANLGSFIYRRKFSNVELSSSLAALRNEIYTEE